MSDTLLLKNGTVLAHQPDDTVKSLANTDILIEGDRIAAIGTSLTAPSSAQILDCTGKIISPGFVDTHHHLWQTQLKGRHADEELLQYLASGNLQCYNYTPNDTYLGQLSGALEALDCGTTMILDHAHGCYTPEHAQRAMDATIASGVRAVFALSPASKMDKWDKEACVPSQDVMPDWILDTIKRWASEGGSQGYDGRVHAGLGFDLFFLPKEMVQGIWNEAQSSGAKLITSHVCRNAIFGQGSTVQLLNDYALLKNPSDGKSIRWVVGHGNHIEQSDRELLKKNDIYVSTTPETEAQMALGLLLALEPNVKGSLGIDCHTNNSSSILNEARTLLQVKRQETNVKVLEQGGSPKKIRGTTTDVFNLATINGARALGMEKDIGSLEVGKKADIVIFDYDNSVGMLCAGDYDPLVSVVRHSDVRDIETVIVNGVIRKANGKLSNIQVGETSIPWAEVAKQTRASQKDIQKRIDGVSVEVAEETIKTMFYIDESKLMDIE